jgi:hypothetical protein
MTDVIYFQFWVQIKVEQKFMAQLFILKSSLSFWQVDAPKQLFIVGVTNIFFLTHYVY